jgi:hypothetical protein
VAVAALHGTALLFSSPFCFFVFPSPQFLFSDAQCLLFLSLFRLKPALSYLILVIQAVKTKDGSSLPSCPTHEADCFVQFL